MEKGKLFSDKKAIRRIFGAIFVMALSAALLGCLLISVVNDVYAFIKSTGEVLLTIDTPVSLSEFSDILYDNGVISNPHIFCLYIRSKNKAELFESFSGEAKLDRSMSYREIILALQNVD